MATTDDLIAHKNRPDNPTGTVRNESKSERGSGGHSE
jgi:hypothetical protein